MLYKIDEAYNENEPKIVGVGKSGSISRIPQRNCKIKIGTLNARIRVVAVITILYISPKWEYGSYGGKETGRHCALRLFGYSPQALHHDCL